MSVALCWLLNNSLCVIYYANNAQKKIVLPFNLLTLVLFTFQKDIGEEKNPNWQNFSESLKFH